MTSDVIARALDAVTIALGPEATYVARPAALRESDTLAGRIDHTLLKADATLPHINHLCQEAMEHQFASVCVNSRWVATVAENLSGSSVLTCSVVGFPLGAMTRRAKAREAGIAVEEGANEIDMVIDIGGLLSGDLAGVFEDLQGVVGAADGRPVKVIIETCLLTDEQKAIACLIARRSGAAYVKTSTGMSTAGATVEDIALMRAVVGDLLGVKASGGIRTRDDAELMIAAGADRVGASASVAIVTGGTGGSGY
jgi:deoxyribose-phosphate aldolase